MFAFAILIFANGTGFAKFAKFKSHENYALYGIYFTRCRLLYNFYFTQFSINNTVAQHNYVVMLNMFGITNNVLVHKHCHII